MAAAMAESESNVFQSIKKAINDFNKGRHDMTIDDLILAKQIEKELEEQGLLKPNGCDCGRYERRS
jgi:hypothetical protein